MTLFQRKKAEPVVVQTIRSVEIPTITMLKNQLATGDTPTALSLAFRAVVRDMERAFGLSIPAGWTDREIVTRWGAVGTMTLSVTGSYVPGELRDVVRRFYAVYEPVRFGPPGTPLRGDPVAILQSIYAYRPMWGLYLGHLAPQDPSAEGQSPGTAGDGSGWEAEEEAD